MARRYVDRQSALRSVAKALDRGNAIPLGIPSLRTHGTVVPHSWLLEMAGNCECPVTIFRDGVYPSKARKPEHQFGRHPMERPVMTEMHVPCRSCASCLRRRAQHWSMRAQSECRVSARTWLTTLTLSPAEHFRCRQIAALRHAKNGDSFEHLRAEDQFISEHKVISEEITRYVKRLRENSGAELRLLCVLEAHKSGLPHYHLLIHEVRPDAPVKHRVLQAAWRLGFSHAKLLTDERGAGYATKYLAKSAIARVRASIRYGDIEVRHSLLSANPCITNVKEDGDPAKH